MANPIENRPAGNTLIAVAIVAAAFIVTWNRPSDQPRYQLAASDAAVYRMDTDSGELIACVPTGCTRVEAPDRAKTIGSFSLSFPGGKKDAEAEKAKQIADQNAAEARQP